MTESIKTGVQRSASFLFPELSSQGRRFSDPFLVLSAAGPPAGAAADRTPPVGPEITEGPPLAGRWRGAAENFLVAAAGDQAGGEQKKAPYRNSSIFQDGVTIASPPPLALDSHTVLSDSFGKPSGSGPGSAGGGCGCGACKTLQVSGQDGAPAWDTTVQAPVVMNGVVSLGTGVNLSNVFRLHSNPTATKTIFLDFDGFAISSTPWENGGGLSLKSFYNTFDTTALTEIQRIWQRVAEDFAPFNVNVTTQDPGSENLRKFGSSDDRWGIRVAFTSNLNLLTGLAIQNAGGGGTAYYNSFNWSTDDVALVFNRGEYTAAETASHEVGHSLGLTHDGSTTTEYYAGHGGAGPTSWGAIMGAAWQGEDENLTQWSKGQYTAANNSQDDLAVITNGNGFSYAADDHGNSFSTATALSGSSFSSFGVIERNTDVDMFRFDTGAGLVSFNIVNASRAFIGSNGTFSTEYLAARGANLDIAATLYRFDQSIVQTFNPSELTTASFSINLAAGTYYLGIDGVGFGTPLASAPSGYTDYASLGQYLLSGTVLPPGTSTPPPSVTPPTTSTPPTTVTPPTTGTPPPSGTGSTLQVIDPNGAVQLLRDTATDLVSVRVNGVSTEVRVSGSQIKASQFADRQILAAETNAAGQNQILWKVVSTGQIRTWSLDRSWSFVSSGTLTDPTSSAGILLQQQFRVDANGTPLPSARQFAAIETLDPIIGGRTSLTPPAVSAFAYDRAAFTEQLPAEQLLVDPSLTAGPLLGLPELVSFGETRLIGIDPLASPFQAAGSGSEAPTPWLVASQPLL